MTKAERILAQLDTAGLKQRLLQYPVAIQEQRAAVRKAKEELTRAEGERDFLEAEMTAEISAAVNEAGKPMYSNDKARAAELVRQKAANPEYQSVARAAQAAEYRFNEAQDELYRLQDEFRSVRDIVRLVAQEISLWTVDEAEENADDTKYAEV